MKKVTITTLLIFALAATVAIAQTAPAPPNPAKFVERHVKMLTTLLSLTDAQQTQATTIFTNAANSQSAVFQQMRAARQSLDTAVKSNNTAGINQAASTIGNLTAQMTAERAKADAAFYQVLTPDQQQKLNEFQSEQHGPMHGPGGPGMFGPRP